MVQNAPTVGLHSSLPGIFVLLFIDPDSFNNIETQDALHFIQTDLISANQSRQLGNLSFVPLLSNATPAAPYAVPAPPYQFPPKAHRYTLLLFKQPINFTISSSFTSFLPLNLSNITNRFPFPVLDFVNTLSLSQLVAANYFDLENSTKSTSAVSVTSAIPTSTLPVVSSASSRTTVYVSCYSLGKSWNLYIFAIITTAWI